MGSISNDTGGDLRVISWTVWNATARIVCRSPKSVRQSRIERLAPRVSEEEG